MDAEAYKHFYEKDGPYPKKEKEQKKKKLNTFDNDVILV